MGEIAKQVSELLRDVEGLPPFGRYKDGRVDGWPVEASETISALANLATREDLCQALIVMADADERRLPKDFMLLLNRVIWDQAAAPNSARFIEARRRGLSVREALLESEQPLA
ncbi:MAG TPA: hypothetical protein VGG72_18130 [Bryobacteraceae bacterium]|jgi:hypothetical protein